MRIKKIVAPDTEPKRGGKFRLPSRINHFQNINGEWVYVHPPANRLANERKNDLNKRKPTITLEKFPWDKG